MEGDVTKMYVCDEGHWHEGNVTVTGTACPGKNTSLGDADKES